MFLCRVVVIYVGIKILVDFKAFARAFKIMQIFKTFARIKNESNFETFARIKNESNFKTFARVIFIF